MAASAAVLVVSSHLEQRKELVHVLEGLGVDTFSTANLSEAFEVLGHEPVALVFCDECLRDGSYRSLLRSMRTRARWPHVVVTTRTGEWPEYLEAVELGAFDMIQFPYRPVDVELNVIRAMRCPVDVELNVIRAMRDVLPAAAEQSSQMFGPS